MSLLVRYTVNKLFKATQENFVVAVCVTWEERFQTLQFSHVYKSLMATSTFCQQEFFL